nr:hypothetical protein CFP56_00840 [Quercus suber]
MQQENDSLIRVDSPLQAQDTFDTEHTAVQPKSQAPARSVAADAGISYRFVPMHKPGQPRDKKEATKVHRHVMRWHLAHVAQRAKSLKRGRKGKNSRATQRNQFPMSQSVHRPKSRTHIEARNLSTVASTTDVIEHASSSTIAPCMSNTVPRHAVVLHTSLQSRTNPDQNASERLELATQPACYIPGRILYRGEPTPYLITPLNQVPFPLCWFNGKLNSFDSLPVFEDAWIDVGKLKWNCQSDLPCAS